MSLLSRYYYKKYMMKTLTDRMTNEDSINDTLLKIIKKSSHYFDKHESYESATFGFFAQSGNLTDFNREFV